jgi:DNA-binding transcriptional MerR regulator
MLKIGDFSALGQVSVKLLRRYDQLGLLPPAHIDERTGYRYYSAVQLLRLNRIQALRDLGFTLQQIVWVLREDISPTQLQSVFQRKHAETRRLMATQQARLARLEARLRQIEQAGALLPFEVLKRVAPCTVASIREIVAPARLPDLFGELDDYLSYYGITLPRPHTVVWHSTQSSQGRMDIEVSCVLTQPLTSSRRISTRTLPEVTLMACVLHPCRPGGSCEACVLIDSWTREHGYSFCPDSAAREVYLAEDEGGSFSIAEMQLPVERSALSC